MNNKTKIIIGAILILTPFLGFPKDVKSGIFVIIGVLIVIYTLKDIREDHKRREIEQENDKDVFAESKPISQSIETQIVKRIRRQKKTVVNSPEINPTIENSAGVVSEETQEKINE